MTNDDLVNLPEIQDQIIPVEIAEHLLDDIAAAAELCQVVVRQPDQTRGAPDSADIELARQALRQRCAIQLRYRLEGQEWWDTLTPHADGVRIVRIAQ